MRRAQEVSGASVLSYRGQTLQRCVLKRNKGRPVSKPVSRGVFLAVASLIAVALAGCSGPYASELEPDRAIGTIGGEAGEKGRWVFNAAGEAINASGLPEVLGNYRLTGFDGPEPNIGITSSGKVFISAMDNVITKVDDRRWEVVYQFDPVFGDGGPSDTGDPMLWVDPHTDIIYNSHMYPSLVCMAVAWSKDDGETWTTNENSCTVTGLDHQKFASNIPGPTTPPVVGDPSHETVLYQCYQRAAADEGTVPNTPTGFTTHCNMSFDGGETWPYETTSAVSLPGLCGGINGHPAPAPDGTMVVPLTRSCDGLYVSVSTDSGFTWTVRPGPKSVGAHSIDPDVAFTPDGTMYAIWRGDDMITYLARSSDLGLTWEGPWSVTAPGLTSTVFQAISAGDDGRIAMAYLGTDDASGDPSFVGKDTDWHLYMVSSSDADAEVPTFDVVQVTPENDPVQHGCVWLYGGGGGPDQCRNMLDFIDSAVHPDGTFHVAFTKGCQSCDSDQRTRTASLAVLDGFSLYE